MALLAYTLNWQHTNALASAETGAANTVRAMQQHAARTVESIDAYLRAVVSLVGPHAGSAAPETIHAALSQQLASSRYLNNIMVIDREGNALHEADAYPARPLNVSDRDYFQTLRDRPGSGLVVGKIVTGRLTGRQVLPVARRMENLDGSFAGVVQAVLDPDAFQATYDVIDKGRTGTLNLWRADGTLLVRSPQMPQVIGRNFASSENYRQHVPIRNTTPFWSAGVTDGVERVIAFGFLDDAPLYVSAALGRADALRDWRRNAITQALIAGGLTGVLTIALLLLAREVQQRQEADTLLRENERRYREASVLLRMTLENMGQGLIFYGPDQCVRVHNERARQIIGLPAHVMHDGARMADVHRFLVEQGEFKEQEDHLGEMVRQGNHTSVPKMFERIRPNGTAIEILGTAMPDGGIVWTFTDITERRKVEAALRESEARFRLLAENTTDVIVWSDLDTTRRYVSPAAQVVFGLDPEHLIGTQPLDSVHPADVPAYQQVLDDLTHGRVEQAMTQQRYRRADGSWVWIEGSFSVMRDGTSGRATGYVASLRDITDRKAAETAAVESEMRYREVLEASQQTILGQLAEGVIVADRSGKLTFVNEAAATIHGVARLDVEPADYSDTYRLYTEDGRPYPSKNLPLACAVRGETVRDARWRVRRREGDDVLVIGSAQPLRGLDGVQIGAVLTFRDDTAREAAERALRELNVTLSERVAERTREVENARTEAERASAAKSEFLAAMSHEIRTPLNGILGYADLLFDETPVGSNARRHAERIRGAGAALLTVVNDILDFSKIEAGQFEIESQPFAISELIESAASIVRATAEKKGLHLHVSAGSNLPQAVLGDRERLLQVLLNLLNNAIKFTRSGEVLLRVEAGEIGRERTRLRFAVRDTGIGIARAKQHLLFERFSQVDSSIQREFGGTGLGLAISKRLIDLMGGEIGMESEEGRGSTFWFEAELLIASSATNREVSETEIAVRSGRRLLLADDVPLNQELACTILRKAGYEVDVVSNGKEAVHAVQKRDYDLVLMDVQMPTMDGITATHHIRALDHPSASIPIIGLTANVLPQQVSELREAGMCDHVGKPFKRIALITAVERWALSPKEDAAIDDVFNLDPKIFAELVEIFGRERVNDLLGNLSDELSQRLDAESTEPNRERLAGDAHVLSSVCGALGFHALANLCREIETACIAGAALEELLKRFRGAKRTTMQQIKILRSA